MSRFRFSLEPLLRVREAAERDQQRNVARIERERLALEQRLRNYQERIGTSKSDMREQLTGVLSTDELRLQSHTALHETRKAQQVVLELAGVYKRLDAARSELVRAMQERRAIELLKERRFDDWKKQQSKLETELNDELTHMRMHTREISQ